MAKATRDEAADGEGNDGDGLTATPAEGRPVFYSASDGLRLYACDYGDPGSPWLPVVCLPGLSRTSRDFHALASHLSSHRHRPRRVVAFDYRGRGKSAWATSADDYNVLTEMNDVFDGMATLGIARAIVVGTSRGGIIGMLMGVARPTSLAGLVLNDVGPALEAQGLARIKAYIGKTPVPDDWTDAAAIQRRLHGGRFSAWGDADWEHFARLTYRDEAGAPAGDYDPALAGTFGDIEFDAPLPDLWNEFRALKAVPMLVIRGENSDLLSEKTVAAMATDHPGLETMTVAGEGHPPLLRGRAILGRISAFITTAEGANPPEEAVVPRDALAFNLETPEA